MVGVSLVGLSGSLIKDSVNDSFTSDLVQVVVRASKGLPPPEPIDSPEATTVLVGKFFFPMVSEKPI